MMKTFLFCICLAAVVTTAFAGFDVNGNSSFAGVDVAPHGSDGEISINVTTTWAIPEDSQALGLFYIPVFYNNHIVAYVDNGDNAIYFMDVDDGTSVYPGGWPTSANNGSPFGVAKIETNTIHVNDWNYDAIFRKYYSTPWEEYNSLTDLMGRGMDYNATQDKVFEFYTTGSSPNYSHYVAIYTPGTSTGSSYELNCLAPSWYGSGCCLYPMWNGDTGIAVTLYQSHWIRFFEYPGNPGGVFYSHAVLPYSHDASLGLTYSEELNRFYHSYSTGSTYYISELEILEASLEADTWAGIKASF